MSRLPTGSGLERADKCPASFALQQAPNTGEDAIAGTRNHDGIEIEFVNGSVSLPPVCQQAAEAATDIEVEAAYAIDVVEETVRFIGYRKGRDYGKLGPCEIALTIDSIIKRPDGVWVWDWKSRMRVTPAAQNLQLRAGAIAVMGHHKLDRVHVGIGYLDNNEADTHTFDAFDVAVFFDDVRGILRRIASAREVVASGKTPAVHSGPWCKYCPAMPYCPAHNRLALAMIGELDFVSNQIEHMTPEQVGKSWEALRKIQALAERVEASLKLRAKVDVVPLSNGKRLAMIESSRSNFDKKKAIAFIREHGGDLKDFEGRTYFDVVREINMPNGAHGVAADHE